MADPLNLPQITGPFNISPPDPSQYYQGSKQQPSGVGTKTEGLAFFADKFLAGAAAGRKRAADHAWEQDQRARQSLMFAMQNLQSANIPDELKQQLMSQAGNTMARMVAGVGEGGDTSKKKTKKGGGQSSDQQDHPATHILDAIKGFANNLLGPGAPKEPVSTEDVNAITGKIFRAIGDPRNNIASQATTLEQQINQAATATQAQNNGQVTLDSLRQGQMATMLAQLSRVTGGKMTPGVNLLIGQAQANSDRLAAEQTPLTQSQIDRNKAEVANFNAEAQERASIAAKNLAAVQAQNTYRDNTTKQTVRQNPDGKWINVATGQPVTPSGNLTPLSKIGGSTSNIALVSGGDGYMHRVNKEDGTDTIVTDDSGRKLKASQQNLEYIRNNNATDRFDHEEMQRALLHYDDKRDKVRETAIDKGWSQKKVQEELGKIDDEEDKFFKKTATPPGGGGKATASPASAAPTPEDIAKRWLPSGGATPPGKANAAGASGSGGIKIISVTPAQ